MARKIREGDKFMRLNGTICLYDGEPVLVNADCMDDSHVYIFSLRLDGKYKGQKVDYTRDNFYYGSLPLGYMNYKDTCSFIARRPSRRQKRATTPNSMTSSDRDISMNKAINSQGFTDMISNKYPTFEEALGQIRNEGKFKRAFDRSFCLYRVHKKSLLKFKEVTVGVVHDDENSVLLYPGPNESVIRMKLDAIGVPIV